MFRVCVGIGVHSLSITCLSFYIIIIPKDFYYFSLRTIHAYAGRPLQSDTTHQRGFLGGRQIPPPLIFPYWPVLGNYILGTPSYVSANRLGR